jgi:hypothetical protein
MAEFARQHAPNGTFLSLDGVELLWVGRQLTDREALAEWASLNISNTNELKTYLANLTIDTDPSAFL